MPEDKKLEEIKRRMLEKITSQSSKSNLLQNGIVNILTDKNFDQVISGAALPILVDFWAEWCMPCKMMAPIMEVMAKDYNGQVYFAKINTDQNKRTQARFRVMSIPNFIIFKDGKQAGQILGSVGRQGLENLLKSYLKF